MKLFWFKYLKCWILLLICIFTEQIHLNISNMANDKLSPNSQTLRFGISSMEKYIMEPTLYLDKQPHQKYPSKVVKFFNHWLEIPDDKAQKITELFDITSIVLNLLEDLKVDSDTRRENKAAQKVHGVPHTLFSTFYATLLAQTKVIELNHPEAMTAFLEELKRFYLYDYVSFSWRLGFKHPTEEEYLETMTKRIAAYVSIPFRLMQLFSTCKLDFGNLLYDMAKKMAIANDYNINLNIEESSNKTFAKLTKAQMTFPIIHAIQNGNKEDVNRLIKQFKEHNTDERVKEDFKNFLKKNGSLDYSELKLKELIKTVFKRVEKLGGNPHADECLGVYKF